MRFVFGLLVGLALGAVLTAMLTGASGGALRTTLQGRGKTADPESERPKSADAESAGADDSPHGPG